MQNTLELGLAENVGSGIMPEVINNQVDARSVHEALEINSPFTHWLKRRIDEFGFVEGEDYFPATSTNSSGFRQGVRADFSLTLDMAKELAMVERNEMGRKMRRYFIECEKRLHHSAPQAAGNIPAGGLGSPALLKIQMINAGLIEEVQHHAARIEQLENINRPGEDWLSVNQWLLRHPHRAEQLGIPADAAWRKANRGKFASIASRAKGESVRRGLAIGWCRNTTSNNNSRTFRPDMIEWAVAREGGKAS